MSLLRADVINLIAQTPGTHGVFDTPQETSRQVFCTVRSVGMSEFYRAHEVGLSPEIVFVLTDSADYEGEKIVEYNGRRYEVIRTYVSGLSIEITCGEARAYVG